MMTFPKGGLFGGSTTPAEATRIRVPVSHSPSTSLPSHLAVFRTALVQSSVCRKCGHVHLPRLSPAVAATPASTPPRRSFL